MDRIILDRKVEIGKEVLMEGPPLEALRFQGGRVGSIVTLTDSRGDDFRGRVLRLSKGEASILIFEAFPSPTESSLEIVLLQALPEKERMELIIQKATELGVSAIVPFKSEKSISLEERETKQKKAHRWQEIAIKAVQQSRRARVPKVEPYRSFIESLEFCKEDVLKILLWEKEGENLKEVLKRFPTLHPPFEKRLCHKSIHGSTEPVLSEPFVPSRPLRANGESTGSPRTEKGTFKINYLAVRPERVEGGTANNDIVSKGGEGGFEIYPPSKVYVMVGPEGGFTEQEVKLAKEKGFIPVKLGQRILRTETAAIALVGILQYELGDLG